MGIYILERRVCDVQRLCSDYRHTKLLCVYASIDTIDIISVQDLDGDKLLLHCLQIRGAW